MVDFLKKKVGDRRYETIMAIFKDNSDPTNLISKPTPDLVRAITDADEPLDLRNTQKLKDCLKILKSIISA